MNATATRRGILAAFAAAPLAVIGNATAQVRPSRLGAKIARVQAISRAASEHDRIEGSAAMRRYEAIVDRLRNTTANLGLNHEGKPIIFTTANPRHVSMSRAIIADPISDERYMVGIRKIAVAADRLEERRQQAGEDSGLAAFIKREDQFSRALCAAEDAVVRHRPGSINEMIEKVDFMIDRDIIEEWKAEHLRADLVALAEVFA